MGVNLITLLFGAKLLKYVPAAALNVVMKIVGIFRDHGRRRNRPEAEVDSLVQSLSVTVLLCNMFNHLRLVLIK